MDHFAFSPPPPNAAPFWDQRYLVHDSFFDPQNGTVFFYTGNEGDVTLYADHAGLMWESAAAFRALLIFAEHRFYGASQPFPGANATQHYGYLSSQLALADYANLLRGVLPALGAAFRTCAPLNSTDDAVALAFWVRAAWDTLAMGSYPYPSNCAYLAPGPSPAPRLPRAHALTSNPPKHTPRKSL